MGMANRDIVVIGASAGGIEALKELVGGLPADLPAAIFIVQHTSPDPPSSLATVLGRRGPMPSETASDCREIAQGRIFVAPSDHHLMIDRSHMYLTQGPRENRSRPAVDPLFRSAAVVHGPHVIGVILSGMLDDGTSGLLAIKRCGGIAVVQDPADAVFDGMPQNALDTVEVDHCVPAREMGKLLVRLAAQEPGSAVAPPLDLLTEVEVSRTALGGTERLQEIGDLVPFTCADCGGPLWKMREKGIARFRCREGHSYTAKALIAAQSEDLERSLWAAVQSLDERTRMLERLVKYDEAKGRKRSVNTFLARAKEAREHADRLRNLLLNVNASAETPKP